jgi:hypothetical protein
MPIWELLGLIGRAIPQMFLSLDFLIILGLVSMFSYSQYRQRAVLEGHLFGITLTDPVSETINTLLYGILGGLLASTVFIGVGIPLSEAGLWYVWPLALLLMLMHPRYLCFSYAGGILALSSLLFGWPELNVPAVISLVAVLHMVEAVLIRWHGHLNPSPVYLRTEEGEVVGGLNLQKFWPLPMLTLILVTAAGDLAGADTVAMPDWWPLIQPARTPREGEQFLYLLFPMMAALGYSDICLSRLPKEKAGLSSRYLAVYSLLLLAAALGAAAVPALRWLAAAGAPLGHELVIRLGQRSERAQPPLFSSRHGAMVLGVKPGSAAEVMGLAPGDVIMAVNDLPVPTPEDVQQAMMPWVIDPAIAVDGRLSGKGYRVVNYKGKLPPLGVVFVPDSRVPRALTITSGSPISRWLQRHWK